ncbi:MAG: (d)CMP kinase [Spirochaetia bacterium]
MKEGIKIAVSGKSGCGNSTVSSLVAERLGLRMINYTFHTMAEEMNINFKELCELAEEDPKYDRHLDRKQVQLAEEGNCVLGSRLAIWMLEDADLKVYLEAPVEVRARRIQDREGGSYEKVLAETRERDRRDTERYRRLYNIDNNEYAFADLILDVSELDQYKAAEAVIREAEKIR